MAAITIAEQTYDDGHIDLTSDTSGARLLSFAQSFTVLESGRITALTYEVYQAPAVTLYSSSASLRDADNLGHYSFTDVSSAVGEHTLTLLSQYTVPVMEGEVWSLAFSFLHLTTTFSIGFKYGANRYSGGAITIDSGSGASGTDDLLFSVEGEPLKPTVSSRIILVRAPQGAVILRNAR